MHVLKDLDFAFDVPQERMTVDNGELIIPEFEMKIGGNLQGRTSVVSSKIRKTQNALA
jgi:hypothetical protein